MTIKYINIFPSQALQNVPKLGFLVGKETIWQPGPRARSRVRNPLGSKMQSKTATWSIARVFGQAASLHKNNTLQLLGLGNTRYLLHVLGYIGKCAGITVVARWFNFQTKNPNFDIFWKAL
jgi:hypothetical protein